MALGLPVLLHHRGLHDMDGGADHVGGAFGTCWGLSTV